MHPVQLRRGAPPEGNLDLTGITKTWHCNSDTGARMSTRWARFARGWLAAVFSTLIAAASHTIAGGPPRWLAIVLSLS